MHLGGVQHPVFGLAPLQGANHSSIHSGGLRFASTTGYYLAALQAVSSNRNSKFIDLAVNAGLLSINSGVPGIPDQVGWRVENVFLQARPCRGFPSGGRSSNEKMDPRE